MAGNYPYISSPVSSVPASGYAAPTNSGAFGSYAATPTMPPVSGDQFQQAQTPHPKFNLRNMTLGQIWQSIKANPLKKGLALGAALGLGLALTLAGKWKGLITTTLLGAVAGLGFMFYRTRLGVKAAEKAVSPETSMNLNG